MWGFCFFEKAAVFENNFWDSIDYLNPVSLLAKIWEWMGLRRKWVQSDWPIRAANAPPPFFCI